MSQILQYILSRFIGTFASVAALSLTDKALKLLTGMSSDPIESELATQQLIAARIFAIYGMSGLRTLVERKIIPDFIMMAYLIRYDLGAGYPQSAYIPDSQPNPFTNPSDLTNDEVAYKKMITFLASRNVVDYSLIEKALK